MSFSDNKIEAMKQKARELSKMVVKNSKTVMNQQKTTETNSISENCANTDRVPSQYNSEFLNNDNLNLSISIDNDYGSIPSCSKSADADVLPKTIVMPNCHSKRKSSDIKLKTKHKKPKIPYLVKCDVYQEEHVDIQTSKKQDDYVLEKLFNKSGIMYLKNYVLNCVVTIS